MDIFLNPIFAPSLEDSKIGAFTNFIWHRWPNPAGLLKEWASAYVKLEINSLYVFWSCSQSLLLLKSRS